MTARATLALVMTAMVVAAASAATEAQICDRKELQTAGKGGACIANERGKAVTGSASNLGNCSKRALRTFDTLDASGSCSTSDDGAGMLVRMYQAVADVQSELAGGPRFVDNGDGTVVDRVAGLQWEMKRNLDEVWNLADPHDADNASKYTVGGGAPNGPLFTDFLDKLNNHCRDDVSVDCSANGDADCAGVGGPCGFAGHRDWRLPTSAGASMSTGNATQFTADAPELESMVDRGVPGCGLPPGPVCVDPIFGPSPGAWSSSLGSLPSTIWVMFFNSDAPRPQLINVNSQISARAVRRAN